MGISGRMEGLKHASGLEEEVALARAEIPNCHLRHGAGTPCISGTLTHSRFSAGGHWIEG